MGVKSSHQTPYPTASVHSGTPKPDPQETGDRGEAVSGILEIIFEVPVSFFVNSDVPLFRNSEKFPFFLAASLK